MSGLVLYTNNDGFSPERPWQMDVKEAAQTAKKSCPAVLMIVSLRDTRF